MILFLTNNIISLKLAKWLENIGEKITIFSKKLSINDLRVLRPELIVSYNYKYILNKEILNFMDKKRYINLHISLLPWNRGAHPNVWSFIENTPKGVTIHLIDEGIDTGDILYQKEVFIDENKHTLKTSYELLHSEIQKLFKTNWEKIKKLEFIPYPQISKGTIHYKKDLEKIKYLFEKEGWDIPIYKFKELVNNWRQNNENTKF